MPQTIWSRFSRLFGIPKHIRGIALKTIRNSRLGLEILEARAVPATGILNAGVWTINGTNAADQISLVETPTHFSFTSPSGTLGVSSIAKSSVTAIVVNGLGGDDTLDASGLFSKGATLNGGNDDDKLTGSGANLASVLQSYPSTAVSIGTSSSGVNLTSMGVVTVGAANYSVWRMRNGTGSNLSGVSLTAFGSGTVFSGDLPAMTDTFFASPFGGSTHVLSTGSGNITKAPGSQTFSYQTGPGDILNGNGGNDSITGGFGNDTINGGAGQDQIDGRSGDDLVLVREAEGENDSLSGGSGTDRVEIVGNWVRFASFNALLGSVESFDANGKEVRGNSSANLLDLSYLTSVLDSPLPGGGLLVKAGDGDDTVVGTSFGDELSGGAGNDSLDGASGDDLLNGGSGDDSLLGREGNDVLYGYSGVDSLDGGADNDVLQVYQGEAELGTLQGDSGSDVLEILGNWARFASFDAAASSLEVIDANGKDIHGNSSSNFLDFSYVTTVLDSPVPGGGLRVKAGAGDDTVTGTVFGDDLSGGAGEDILRGGLGNDYLRGNSGNDTLEGQSGNDTLFGGNGVDSLDGGENDDILQAREGEAEFGTLQGGEGQDSLQVLGNWVRFSYFDAGASSIEVFDANGKAIRGNATANTLDFSCLTSVLNSPLGVGKGLTVSAENGDDLVIGTSFGDSISGGDGNDVMRGLGGSDVINGNDGDDAIEGGEGDDTLSGGKGSDMVSGGNGDDTIRLAGRESIGDSFDGGEGADTLLNSGNSPWVLSHFVTVDGSWTGGERNVSGVEVLDLNGQQILGRSNGSGGDTDENDDDLLDFSGVIINNLSPSGIDGRNGDDQIVGTSNADLIFGSGGNDLIYSGGGNDSLFGGAGIDYTFGDIGDDLISGGMQGDALEGGLGADTFWFKISEMSAADSYDFIIDFSQGVDKIRLNFSVFGTVTPQVNQGTSWVRGQIIVDTVSEPGNTIIRLPNNPNRMIKLLGVYNLTSADFDLY